MKRYVVVLMLVFAVPLAAQQPAQGKPPAPPTAPQAPSAPQVPATYVDPSSGGQPVNIRLDVAVTDQKESAAAQPKTVMVILADRALGQTRAAYEDRSISVDARTRIVEGLIRVDATVKSQEPPRPPIGPGEKFTGPDPILNWTNSFSLLLTSSKPMLAFETSDPVTKRKLSIEVKATILK